MARFDLPVHELEQYRPAVRAPRDFDEFWKESLVEARRYDTEMKCERIASPLETVDVFDVRFPGFDGEPIAGWLLVPTTASGPRPAMVEYLGYGAGRGLAHERLLWASTGFVYLVMDTRGQGAESGTGGVTPDPHGSDPAHPGFVTRGLRNPHEHYYRRLIVDAVRAVDAVTALDAVDAERVHVTGVSQGGGLALATAGLHPGLAGVLADVPFLCHFERAVGFTDRGPYAEVAKYLAVHRGVEDDVFDTLSYVDAVNFAERISAPTIISVGLQDAICPPSTVFAAYNRIGSEKRICMYPFNEHEGGQAYQWREQMAFLRGRNERASW
ncbi:MAG TPA: acetylxylan esterase [Microbacterium sp.]|jgi:cephalosporin-C deacetylase|uniref:acetylxylan esterase n=1 Tax=Microbacterium sp. TaxID=51671 RepID=UPI002F957D2F